LRTAAEGVAYGEALFEPSPDGALGKISAGFPVTRIIEADHCATVLARPGVERLGLGPPHVGLEPAEPQQRGRAARTPAQGNPPSCFPGSNLKEFQARIAHLDRTAQARRIGKGLPCFDLNANATHGEST
jgi:hypothetical protein